MEIAGQDTALVAHDKGAGEGLAAGGGAHIQDLLAGLYTRNQGHQTGRRVLHQEFSLPEGLEGGQISRAGELQAVRHPGMGRSLHAAGGQLLQQIRLSGAYGVHLHRQRRNAVIGGQERLRFLPAQQRQQPLHQPFGMAVPDGEIALRVPVRDFGQIVFMLCDFPQHRVHQASGLAPLKEFGQIDRLVDGGAVWHLVQEQNLIGAQPQNVRQRGLQVVNGLGAVSTQVKVKQQLVLQDAIDHAAAQGRVGTGQSIPGNLRLQDGVRPGTFGPAGDQHPQGSLSAHSRPPPLRPPPLRPRKIKTYRSSCSMDISRAAT